MRGVVATAVLAGIVLAGLSTGIVSAQSDGTCVTVGTFDSENEEHPTTLLLEGTSVDYADIAETTDDSDPDGCLRESLRNYFIYRAPAGEYTVHVRNDESPVYERWGIFEETVGDENETFIYQRAAPYHTDIGFESPRSTDRFEPGETAQFEARVYNAEESGSRDVTTEVYVYPEGETRPNTPTERLAPVSVAAGDHSTVGGSIPVPDTEGTYVVDVEFVTDFGFGEFTSDYVDLGTITVDSFEPPSIDSSSPESGAVSVGPSERETFSVSVSDPDSTPTVQWSVDGERTTSGTSYEFDAERFGPGEHTVSVRASDDTDLTADATTEWTVDVADAPEITSVSPGNTEVVLGETVTFSADAESAGLDYEWIIDGREFTGSSVERTFTSTGEKSVGVAVTNDRGVTTRQSFVVTVERAPPSVDGLSVSPSSATVGESVAFLTSATDPAGRDTRFDYEWTVGNRTFQGSSAETTFSEAGSYDATLTVTNDYGSSTTQTRTVTVEAAPPSITEMSVSRSSVTIGDSVTLTADALDPDGRDTRFDYQWSVGNRTFSGSTVEATFSRAGNYDVELVVENDFGETTTRTRTLTVEAAPPEVTDMSVSPSSMTAGDQISLSATATDTADRGTAFTYEWTVGDETFSGATAETHLDEVGTHDVELVVTNEYGTSTIRTRSVTVSNDEPTLEQRSPEARPTPRAGTEQRFVVRVADDDAEPTTVTWSVDGQQASNQSVEADERRLTFTHRFTDPGTHTVGATIEDGHDARATVEWTAAVENRPPRIEEADPASSTGSRMSGTTETFDATATDPDGGPVSYRWFVDGSEQATGPRYTHTFEDPGTHNVTVIVTDSDGGVASHSWSTAVQNFRAVPEIDASTTITEIRPGSEGEFIALSFRNPSVNNRTAQVELALSLPDGVTVSSTRNIHRGSQPEYVGQATVNPSQQTSVSLAITVEDESLVGQQIDVPYQVIYYPDGQRDSFRVVENATTTLRVVGESTTTNGTDRSRGDATSPATGTGANQRTPAGDEPTSGTGPGFTAGGVLLACCLWLRVRRS